MKVVLLIFIFFYLTFWFYFGLVSFGCICPARLQLVVFSRSLEHFLTGCLKRIPPPPLINFWHGAWNSSCVNKSSQPLLVSVSEIQLDSNMPQSRAEVANFAAAKWSSPGEHRWCVCLVGYQSCCVLGYKLHIFPPRINVIASGIVFYIKDIVLQLRGSCF